MSDSEPTSYNEGGGRDSIDSRESGSVYDPWEGTELYQDMVRNIIDYFEFLVGCVYDPWEGTAL
jgi:hypothetical protein